MKTYEHCKLYEGNGNWYVRQAYSDIYRVKGYKGYDCLAALKTSGLGKRLESLCPV